MQRRGSRVNWNRLKTVGLMAAIGFMSALGSAQAESSLVIGTGSVAGVYYPSGGAICRFYELDETPGGGCDVVPTGGSIDNLAGLRDGRFSLVVVQSDWQYYAYTGQPEYEEATAFDSMRSLFSLHSEPFTILARADSGIVNFDDLKGHRVNLGQPGSGQRGTLDVLMASFGWTYDDFQRTSELAPLRQGEALCDYRLDAITYAAGHPNPAILEASQRCDTVLVPVTGDAIDRLLDQKPYYRMVNIPGGLYPGNPDPVQTLGMAATVVTTTQMPEEIAYRIVKAVFENFDTLTRLHPAFASLDPATMVNDGLSAPLHPGARRYYEEVGLL
ncbi:TAXI family TRAP transporter solute-binding subunit [Saccharospirillum impatiens]|uniref:TAXI family TRAP transporter solute-binding subunit n=1 Tax=Saccharospirillum impatiens TaxID=169438 RepID=UPI00041889FA|nr:TAXI family TRAP transporter solute-binding subunit [Saccharospirillum impatiens]